MATVITSQILVDTNRDTVIKIVGKGGGDSNTTLIVAANLAFALNATGVVSTLNPKRLNRTSVRRAWGQGQMGLSNNVTLVWGGNNNTAIFTFGSGPFNYSFASDATPGHIRIQIGRAHV